MQADFGGGMTANFGGDMSGGLNFATNVQPTGSVSFSAGGGLSGSSTVSAPIVYPGPASGHVSVSADLPSASVAMNTGYPGGFSATVGAPNVYAGVADGHMSVSASLPTANISMHSGHAPMVGVSVSADAVKVDKKKKKKEKKEGESPSSSSEDEDDEKKSGKSSPKAHASVNATVAVPAVNLSGGAAVTMTTPMIVAGPTGGGVSFTAGYAGPHVGVAIASPHGGVVSIGGGGDGKEHSSSSSSEDEDDENKKHKSSKAHGDKDGEKKKHKSSKAHASTTATVAVPAAHLNGNGAVTVTSPMIAAGPIGGGVSFNAGYAGPHVGVAMGTPHGGVYSIGGVGSVAVGGGGFTVTTAYPAQRTVVKSSGSCVLL